MLFFIFIMKKREGRSLPANCCTFFYIAAFSRFRFFFFLFYVATYYRIVIAHVPLCHAYLCRIIFEVSRGGAK